MSRPLFIDHRTVSDGIVGMMEVLSISSATDSPKRFGM
jgi:hypothetical protein